MGINLPNYAELECDECGYTTHVDLTEYYDQSVGFDDGDLPSDWEEQAGEYFCPTCKECCEICGTRGGDCYCEDMVECENCNAKVFSDDTIECDLCGVSYCDACDHECEEDEEE